MTSSVLGGIVTPPPLVIIRHFLATPLIARVIRDKTDFATKQRTYVGFLTVVEGHLQAVAAMTILSFGI